MFQQSTIAEQIGDSLSERRFETLLLLLFSVLALVLAGVGIYGVVYQSVSQRRNEIGIRVALGAQRSNLVWMVMSEAVSLVACGALIGALAAFAPTRTPSSVLFSVKPGDPLTYVTVAVLLMFAAALAAPLPARRATKIDPIHALRCD